MRQNANTVIVGATVVLVPYEPHHVPVYHRWMENAALRFLTGSERLTLDEEFAMQRQWRMDSDKCTFIVLDRVALEANDGDELHAMVGDVNLFSIRDDADDDEERTRPEPQNNNIVVEQEEAMLWKAVECEIMIAEEASRGKGFGKEAMLLMIKYAIDNLHPSVFIAKIKTDNITSQNLFAKIGFEKFSQNDVFQEVQMRATPITLLNLLQHLISTLGNYSEWKERIRKAT
ncbi:N-acetyltransferase 9 protein-like [Tropilaelaps mercedesae]|uniref:N-acetyltransferase 9 protein-like n=1 Tax=Tropilaelaps mercedesae TaxID=418985 RepID=A0A1V9XWT3_9ACAR|nr:N-acetyltransferase 9 protein-like [Tropilaelaps mercedesae]